MSNSDDDDDDDDDDDNDDDEYWKGQEGMSECIEDKTFKLVECYEINLRAKYCQSSHRKQRNWIYLSKLRENKIRVRKSSG